MTLLAVELVARCGVKPISIPYLWLEVRESWSHLMLV